MSISHLVSLILIIYLYLYIYISILYIYISKKKPREALHNSPPRSPMRCSGSARSSPATPTRRWRKHRRRAAGRCLAAACSPVWRNPSWRVMGIGGILTHEYVWVNYNLTATSLEIIVNKGNHPQMALVHVSELL